MTIQLTIPLPDRKENNSESQAILNANKEHFSKQCEIVLQALMRGERLTTASALLKYGIGDLRRRTKDLRDYHNIPVQSELIEGRFKEYFLDSVWIKNNAA